MRLLPYHSDGLQHDHIVSTQRLLCMQRLLELHDGDGDGVILHEEFLSALCAIRKLASGNPQDRLASEQATV
jgi:hypothetical protein